MEQKEFETLIRQIRPKLHTEALRLLTDSDEAEDVTQETVLKLWTIREQLEAYRSVEALAVVMVRRLAFSRKRVATTIPLADWQQTDTDSIDSPEDLLISQEEETKVIRMISTLPDHPSEPVKSKKENPKNVHAMMKEKEIQQLIERFLGGATTNAEEQMLYDYFNSKDVADSLRPYREMFRWYAAGMPEQKAKPSKRPYAKWLAIAASMLLLVGIGFGYRYYQEQQELYAIYEGSYIIRDGIKNTDIRQILPELQATEQEVANALKQQNNNQEIPTI